MTAQLRPSPTRLTATNIAYWFFILPARERRNVQARFRKKPFVTARVNAATCEPLTPNPQAQNRLNRIRFNTVLRAPTRQNCRNWASKARRKTPRGVETDHSTLGKDVSRSASAL